MFETALKILISSQHQNYIYHLNIINEILKLTLYILKH